MKKAYQTPEMAVELFELTQSIASCDLKIGFTDSDCVTNDASSTDEMKDLAWAGFFWTGCSEEAEGMDGGDGICYHTNANAAFSS